ncbi:MAG: DUF3341 domain-containing protein [Polyangiales bacterium]
MPSRLAEFSSPEALVAACRALRAEGYVRLEAYTPFAVPELGEVLAVPPSRAPRLIFGAGISGGALALLLQWWCNAYDFPLNVGGRPMLSIPAWIPVAFELTVLAAGATAFFAMIVGAGLPRLHDPIDASSLRSVDRFLLAIDLADPKFVPESCARLLETHGAIAVSDPEATR